MLDSRPLAVSEIKRVLKQAEGRISVLVVRRHLVRSAAKSGKKLLRDSNLGRGGFLQKWALVTL